MNREIKFRNWNGKKMVIWKEIPNPTFTNFKQLPDRDCVIMQFTGLKDKNGKEIFEGDIVTTDFILCTYRDGKTIVEFKDGRFGFKYKGDFIETGYANKSEVIGNIYENPELIINQKEVKQK